jgi:hypothetical protein
VGRLIPNTSLPMANLATEETVREFEVSCATEVYGVSELQRRVSSHCDYAIL